MFDGLMVLISKMRWLKGSDDEVLLLLMKEINRNRCMLVLVLQDETMRLECWLVVDEMFYKMNVDDMEIQVEA